DPHHPRRRQAARRLGQVHRRRRRRVLAGRQRPLVPGETEGDPENPETERGAPRMKLPMPRTLARPAATVALTAAVAAALSAGSTPIRLLGVSTEANAVLIEAT